MLAPVLHALAVLIVALPIVVAILGGLVAIRAIRRDPIKIRPDRTAGVAAAALSAGVIGAFFGLYVASFASPFVSNQTAAMMAIEYGGASFTLALLAGLAGYAFTTRFRAGSGAAVGGLLAPLVLIGVLAGAGLGSVKLVALADDAGAAATAAEIADRSAGISIQAETTSVSMAPGGRFIASVTLRVTATSDHDLLFESGGKSLWPRFYLSLGTSRLDGEALPGDPTALLAGQSVTYDVEFMTPESTLQGSGTYAPPAPGTWTLDLSFPDVNEGEYKISTTVDIVAPD